MKAKNVGHSGGPPYDRHVPLIEIVKRLGVSIPFYSGADGLCRVGPALNGHLRNTRQGVPIISERERQITDDENVWKTSNSEVGIHLDAAAAVCLRAGALAELPPECIGCDTAGPKHGLCLQTF